MHIYFVIEHIVVGHKVFKEYIKFGECLLRFGIKTLNTFHIK